MASFGVFPPATLRSKYALPSVALRSWTTAIMCNALLIWRLPPRESRCRTLSPEDASMGADPVQDAKWPLVGNRVMSPTSTSSPAAGS